jgi:hypothetical protein
MLDGRGMDYETMGAIQGMGRDLRTMERNQAETIAEANRQIRLGNETIRELRRQLAQAQAALQVETAHRVGITAQGRALKAELTKLDPTNGLFARTGKSYPKGVAQLSLNLVYEQAFDAKALEFGYANPKELRAQAK